MTNLKAFMVLAILFTLSVTANAQSWVTDQKMNFKINLPSDWTKKDYTDGTDKVYDFYSADENLAIQLRAFDAPDALTMDLLVNVFEEQMLPAGTTKESLIDHVSKNGIHGKQGTYLFNYNGNKVAMGVFYAIAEGKGYVINAMIPESLLEQRFAEIKAINESFALLSAPQNNNAGLGGLSGLLSGLGKAGDSGTNNGSVPFRVTKVTLCDQLDQNNRAVTSKNVFNTKTPEVHAVIEYEGYTSDNIVVRWNYRNTNRMITEDSYTFSNSIGGVGVVSLSKPTNDWPVGEYWVEFYQGTTFFMEIEFKINY